MNNILSYKQLLFWLPLYSYSEEYYFLNTPIPGLTNPMSTWFHRRRRSKKPGWAETRGSCSCCHRRGRTGGSCSSGSRWESRSRRPGPCSGRTGRPPHIVEHLEITNHSSEFTPFLKGTVKEEKIKRKKQWEWNAWVFTISNVKTIQIFVGRERGREIGIDTNR